MKKHLWLLAVPIIAVAALFQLTFDLGEQGKLDNSLLREQVYPIARRANGLLTDIKFRIRGEVPVKNKIVILDVDDDSVEQLGRWPWYRYVFADTLTALFEHYKVKAVGMDITFSEPENRVPKEVYEIVEKAAPTMLGEVKKLEGDPELAEVIRRYRDRIVLGQSTGLSTQLRYAPDEAETAFSDEVLKSIEENIGKFALKDPIPFGLDVIRQSPLVYMVTALHNIPIIRDSARYAGLFSVNPDPDGVIRRYALIEINGQKVYPSLALQLAELAKDDRVRVEFTPDARISKMYFSKTPEASLPVTNLGHIDMNFRGKARTFTYVSVADTYRALQDPNEKIIHEKLRDSIVLFGVSALALFDMRNFPFDNNTPGVEGHATALDNILSNDALRSATGIRLKWLPMALLIVLGLGFSFLFSRFEAIPSLLIFAAFALIFGAIDTKVLFQQDINLPTAFLFLEILLIFTVILAVRYIIEERDKKEIRKIFSQYLAPAVVDMVLKDPTKLQTGGERKEISILFSDLAGFTTISESMEPKVLAQFLNEYLTEMTDIVFENEGTLDKYIGDAVMAFWSAPIHQSDHAFRACRAAVRMQERIREIAPDFKARYGVDISMRVGVNSGVVSVGNMGSKKIMEYTVIGDHVNLASRLEGLNSLYDSEVLTTRASIDLLPEADRNKIHYRMIDSVKVKGKSQAVEIIQLARSPFPAEVIELYATAREEFKKRHWDEAERLFRKCMEIQQKHNGESDTVAEAFLERLEIFRANPPDEKWDGTIEMRTK